MAKRWKLRVHAEGAQGIKAASMLDAKPDPYVIFVFGGVTKQCAPVNDVEPVKYFTWPNAVVEFEVTEETAFLQSSLVLHVKDSDTFKDRFIGGASIPLGTLYAAKQGDALCQSKFFVLDFSDEKLKTKKICGEVKLTIQVIATLKKSEPAEPVKHVEKETTKTAMEETTPGEMASVKDGDKTVRSIQSTETKETEPKKETLAPAEASMALETTQETTKDAAHEDRKQRVPAVPTEVGQHADQTVIPKKPTQRDMAQATAPLVNAELQKQAPPTEKKVTPQPQPPSGRPLAVKKMTIELVSARKMTRPTSLGAIFDRKPDPMVTMEFYGASKSSVALKDVDLKKPVEWKGVFLEFDLPQAPFSSKPRRGCGPMTLVVHVKDTNLMKATYMGGGALDLSEFFVSESEYPSRRWIASAAAQGMTGLERVVELAFSDEKLTKKKQCGEITVRFTFVYEDVSNEGAGGDAGEKVVKPGTSLEVADPATEVKAEEPSAVDVTAASEPPPSLQLLPPAQAEVTPPQSLPQVSTDMKMLSIELLCGRDLVKPTVKSLAKSVVKSLFDRKPDPYAVMVLGSQTKKCPTLNDVDVAFFEWTNAVQVFEFSSKPYPTELLVHIRDNDIAGSDPYMGGARIPMEEIWDEASRRATSQPPGDPQVVKTYQLKFIDEKMTKQKACGSITVRFRWVYADAPLPLDEAKAAAAESSSPLSADVVGKPDKVPKPPVAAITGFLHLRKMVLLNNKDILDPSLDLYIEVASASPSQATTPGSSGPVASSSVLTDATKGFQDVPGSKVEWIDDELVVPICVPRDGDYSDIVIHLRDKNAILKDEEIASKAIRLRDCGVDLSNSQGSSITVELMTPTKSKSKSSTPKTVQFEAEARFLPHNSPLVSVAEAEKHGGVFTLFLVGGTFKSSPLTGDTSVQKGPIAIAVDCLVIKKSKGLLSFHKSDPCEYHTTSLRVDDSSIYWWSASEYPLTGKQVATMKEKEVLEFELQVRTTTGKSEKTIGTIQLNAFPSVFGTTAVTQTQVIEFGALGAMELEFAAAFRALNEVKHSVTSSKAKDAKPVAPPVPSGDLHILILSAKNLVSPDPKIEKAEDLDPEVRISIEPKYIKRKDNPVRSMLKTKPLENAGAVPTWNEYVRVEYRLPSAPPPPVALRRASLQAAIEAQVADVPAEYPPPIVQLGIFDIQMPGEKNGSQPVGKIELPLSAFLLPIQAAAGSSMDTESVALSVDVYLAGKKTGSLMVEGVFEPLAPETKPSADDVAEKYCQRCRAAGRRLRDKAKKLKSGELIATAADVLSGSRKRTGMAGRLELHIIGFKGNTTTSFDTGLVAHVWLSNNIEERHEFKSKLRGGDDAEQHECQVIWDAWLTLYTVDVTAELLRTEVLTLSGQPVGSLKLPLSGLHSSGQGTRPMRDWYTIIDSSSTKPVPKGKEPCQEVLIELCFFADQEIFDPLAFAAPSGTLDTPATVVVSCRRLLYIDGADSGAVEIAVKCSLTGALAEASSNKAMDAGVKRTSFKVCGEPVKIEDNTVAVADWNETLTLEIGSAAATYISWSFASGMHPAVRFDLLVRRTGARFPSTPTSATLSLVSLAQAPARKASRWVKLFDEGDVKSTRLVGLMLVEVIIVAASMAKEQKVLLRSLEDAKPLRTAPGVLCLRFLSARNLVDVDVNGDQDPYIVAKVMPRNSSTASKCQCQTGVSLNGGRHPTWNTTVFEMVVEDLATEYLRIEVLDSNEEDHLPDAYIGAIDMALSSLFRDYVDKKTRWLEAWVPIYPIMAKTPDGESAENVGEIRVEFRFLSQAYRESASRQAAQADVSPFTACDVNESIDGTMYVHVIQALGVPCTKGMQPGVRVASGSVAQVTKPGKESIENPTWDSEVLALPWCRSRDSEDGTELQIELVDLSVRTANANALAVVAFGRVDVLTFLEFPRAKSYHLHRLQGRKASSDPQTGPSVLLGFQFIPTGEKSEATTLLEGQDKRGLKSRTGSLHLKVLDVQFDVAALLSYLPLATSYSLQLQLTSKDSLQAKTIKVPSLALTDLIEANGLIPLASADQALLFKYSSDDSPAALEWLPNPIVTVQLISTQDQRIAALFDVPIFDYVLVDGHLSAATYALTTSDSADQNPIKIGRVKLEVQYLPTLSPDADAAIKQSSAEKDAAANDAVAVYDLEIQRVRGVVKPAAVCVVVAEWLGCRAETKPNIPSTASTDLEWNECLGLAVSPATLTEASSILQLELRDAADMNVVLGTCRWIVPSSNADSKDVVVPLDPPSSMDMTKSAKVKAAGPPAEIVFRFAKRDSLTSQQGGAGTSGARYSGRRRALFYILPTGPASNAQLLACCLPQETSSSVTQLKKALDPSTGASWVELSSTERRVVAIDEQNLLQVSSHGVVIVMKNSVGDNGVYLACIDSQALVSIFKAKVMETFHRLPILALGKPSSPPPTAQSVECKIMCFDVVEGALEMQLERVTGFESAQGSAKFCLEVRLLGTNGVRQWQSSPQATWDRKTREIVWRSQQSHTSLGYSNLEEMSEPVLQLVLLQVVGHDQSKRLAFGQVNVLQVITKPDEPAFQLAMTELTRVDGSESLMLTLQLRFVRDELTVEERQAQEAATREAKALQLAEGTAVLKKAFAAMGGDESTPIQIEQLKKYVMEPANSRRNDEIENARQVLQHAADLETEGDLDALFAMMDVNDDGQISWGEYADHMQNVHALAEAEASQSMMKEAKRGAPPTETDPEVDNNDRHIDSPEGIIDDDEEEDDLGDEEDVPGPIRIPTQAVEVTEPVTDVYKAPTVSLPSGQPTMETSRPGQSASEERRKTVRQLNEEATKTPRPPSKTVVSDVVNERRPLAKATRNDSEPPRRHRSTLSPCVLDWKVEDVLQWMTEEMELPQYADAIQTNAVNGKLLLTLREDELASELGIVAVLHKRKLINQISEFQERFQYPPPPLEKKKAVAKNTQRRAPPTSTLLVTETPAFIKREQLVYHEKQRVKEADSAEPWQPTTLGQSRVFPSKTMVVPDLQANTNTVTKSVAATTESLFTDLPTETFDDAMADIFEAIHPESPQRTIQGNRPQAQEDPDSASMMPLPRLPRIQIGSITNTDELFEIVRQRIHQLSQLLIPIAARAPKDTHSDFGDDPDDGDNEPPPPSEEMTGLGLVFNALSRSSPSLSRLKFQEGVGELLAIDVSWHQFDLLFRRLDVDGDSEFCWDEFHHVFTRRHISFEQHDLLTLQEALVTFVLARLESQQWTLSDLFKAFDRDGGGAVSTAEFATLVRFLFTSSVLVKQHQQETKKKITKRHVYLLMSCLDGSADRRITLHEFLRFFFIVWSTRLMEVQDQLLEVESVDHNDDNEELVASLKQAKRTLRRALRTNFSRPFRDAMRCLDVSVPGPFTGVLSRLQLLGDTSPQSDSRNQQEDSRLQVWQVLQGQTSASHRAAGSYTHLQASTKSQRVDASRRRAQKGKNEVQRTRLTRQREPHREPHREDAVLRSPATHLSLDAGAQLKYDFRPPSQKL